jgi:hypothetical protein
MKPFITLFFLCLFLWGTSQVTIAVQDFEASPAGPTMTFTTTDVATIGAGTGISTGQTGAAATNAPSAVNLFASGTQGYRVQGPAAGGLASRTLTFNNINTTAYNNIKLSFRMAGMSLGSNANGMDGSVGTGGILSGSSSLDVAVVEVSPDGGTTWYQQGAVNVTAANANVRWSFGAAGSGTKAYAADNAYTTFTTTGTGTITAGSTAITKAEITSLPSVANLKVRITLQLSGSTNESWVIDDVLLTGNFVSTNSNFSNIIPTASFTAPSNIDYKNYQATDITTANSVEIAQFTIQDGGGTADADILATTLNNLSFTLGNNTNIRRVAIYDGSTEIAETAGGANVNFVGISGLSAPDDGSKTFSLRVTYNSTVTDNQQYQFTVNSTVVDASGSGFAATNAGGATSSIAGDNNKIEVVADRLAFIQNTTSPTNPNVSMVPAPTVSANDINNNRDLDYTGNVDITSSGTLQSSPLSAATINGAIGFNNIIHTTTGTGFILTATSGSLINTTSNAFDIAIATSPTDYFRSKQIGNWNTASTWESSIDNINWINATLVPDFNANIISIAHTVTMTTSVNANQIVVKNNGTLINAIATGTFTLNYTLSLGGFTIENGGVYQITTTQNYASHINYQPGAEIDVLGGGIIRMGNGGTVGGGANGYLLASNISWQSGAIFDWNSTSTPGATNVTYFPITIINSSNNTPILRFSTSPLSAMGGNTALTVNGILEANVPITYDQIGDKIFAGGISNNANVTFSLGATGKVILGDANRVPVLGGTGIINLSPGGMTIGYPGQTGGVVLLNNKTINGTINLINNAIVVLSTYTLTVNAITGGFADPNTFTYRFVDTELGGALKINNVGSTAVTYPIGSQSTPRIYSPVTIVNTGTVDNFSVSHNRSLPSCLTGSPAVNSVNGTWNISEDVVGGSNVALAIDYANSTTGSGYVASAAKVVHCNGSTSDYANGSVTGTIATCSGFTNFSPFGVTSDAVTLPIKLNAFTATYKINNIVLNWQVAFASGIVNYTIEKSTNGVDFKAIGIVGAQSLSSYTFDDNNPVLGNNYYRLKINVSNGTHTYSSIQKVKINGKALTINNIYPSPTKEKLTIAINYITIANATVEIINTNGKRMYSSTLSVNNGLTQKEYNVTQLPSGIYFVKLSIQNEVVIEKFIKH